MDALDGINKIQESVPKKTTKRKKKAVKQAQKKTTKGEGKGGIIVPKQVIEEHTEEYDVEENDTVQNNEEQDDEEEQTNQILQVEEEEEDNVIAPHPKNYHDEIQMNNMFLQNENPINPNEERMLENEISLDIPNQLPQLKPKPSLPFSLARLHLHPPPSSSSSSHPTSLYETYPTTLFLIVLLHVIFFLPMEYKMSKKRYQRKLSSNCTTKRIL
mmetsp:Transcript_33037/g.48515  ORF Transcript_33037/g.48515 Transcript_33037/m.48515 type:complete len:215 (+) Transcript_33037:314-958(+)